MKRFFLFFFISTLFISLFAATGLAEGTYTEEIVSITFDSLETIDLGALLSTLQDAQNTGAPVSKSWTDGSGATYTLTYYSESSCLDGSAPQTGSQSCPPSDELSQLVQKTMSQLAQEAASSAETHVTYESTVYWTTQPAPVPTIDPAVFWTAQPAPAPTAEPSVFQTPRRAPVSAADSLAFQTERRVPAPTARPAAYSTACPVAYCTAVPVAYCTAVPVAYCTAVPVSVQQPSSCGTIAYQPAATAAPTRRTAALPTAQPTVSTGDYTTFDSTMQEQKLLNLLNEDRARNGLPPLTLDPELSRLAELKSSDMNSNHYFAHESPTYGTASQMLDTFHYDYQGVGENIAHHGNVEKAEAAFMSSDGHRRNILGSQWSKVGLGVVYDENGYVYVTQLFAR